MKRKIICYSLLLFLVTCSQLQVRAYTDDSPVVFEQSVSIGATFEWIIQKYDVIERPTPEAYTFFKFNDTLKIEVIGNPPSDLGSWGYRPKANFTDWLEFYKNDAIFNITELDYLPLIFDFGFIYPISITDAETECFFEYYSEQVEFMNIIDLNGGYSSNLDADYFEAKLDQTSSKYVHSRFHLRKYNIHTGILSEYVEEYDNFGDTSYLLEIANPADVEASITILVPMVALLAIGVIYLRKRRINNRV